MIEAIFKNLCPNCGGDISSYRLAKGLPCEKCLEEESENVCDVLKEGLLKERCDIEKELNSWEEYFYKYTNLKPWALQKTWAKRVFLKESFSLIAPTGIGKSSFGISLAAFLSTRNKKSYVLVPTKLLLKQTFDRLLSFGVKEEDILIFGLDAKKDKSLLKTQNYKILITTNMFLYKNEELIPRDFDFIFVDDIDSFLKTAKNIDKLLYIMGFEKDIIDKTFELLKLKSFFRKNEAKLKAISQEINDYLSTHKQKTVLVLASATSKPKSKRVLAFKELLGFELSTPTYYLRNITDTFDEPQSQKLDYKTLIKYINTFGKGGLVFVSAEKGKDTIKEIIETLNKNHIKAISYEDIKEDDIKAYENGDIDVLVGIASYRNPLARGIDLPHVIRYAVFYGVPKIEIPLSLDAKINHLVMALLSIKNIFINTEHYQTISELIEQLNRYRYVKEENDVVKNLKQKAKEFLSQKDIIEKIENSKDITLKKQNDKYYILIPDITGYIQASGRTSRLYAGGISKGLSVVLVDDKATFESLKKKLLWLGDIKFENIKDVDIQSILKAIDQDRENLRAFIKKEKVLDQKDVIKPTLVIVESPTKARTISSFFGKPARRTLNNVAFMEFSTDKNYIIITASIGHILDVTKNEGFDGVLVTDDHIIPIYETIEGKDNIVKSLRLAGIEIEKILIATDPDTEGEKIAWDLKEILSAFCKDIKRMEFHEVTKKAIANAIENSRDIKEPLVKAQVLRRVADRWVGFEYSKLIQKHFGKNWLSAGRVQTPVLGWIIERYNLHKVKIFRLSLKTQDIRIDFDIEDKTKAKTYYENVRYITIKTIKEEERFLEPSAPYTTDTLLKDASEKLKLSVKETMELAQELFEMGYITYHRTDSTHVSEVGISIAKSFIEEKLGKEYFKPRTWGKEGTHECIRPTKSMAPEDIEAFSINQDYGYQSFFTQQITKKHIRLYQLIFNRFMASQTRQVKVLQKTLLVSANTDKPWQTCESWQTCEPWHNCLEKDLEIVDKILEDGWNIFIPINTTQIRKNNGNITNTFEIEEKELRAIPKMPLYTQGELVKEMKEKGIGRPSTYSIIISRLLERKYVIEKKSRLIPTKLGIEVYNFLKQSKELSYLVSEEFTRELEQKMDIISEKEGEDYKEVLKTLYDHLKFNII